MPANQETRIRNFDEIEDNFWSNTEILNILESAAESFIKYNNNEVEIWAASRDWFLEPWGRDTFISLPGLLLVRNRFEDAKNIFRRFAKLEKNGLLPTKISNEIEYNNADVSLWFIYSLKKYIQYSHDFSFIKEMLQTIKNILESYVNGTGYYQYGEFQRIYMDSDYLIVTPPQATWMDANAFGKLQPITPRNGKVVEINALFYSLLTFVKSIEEIFGYEFNLEINEMIFRLKKSFNRKFWNKEKKALFDVIEGDPHGNAIRPNMIFAVSHCNNLLDKNKEMLVFDCVKKHLLTPCGLRTLSPEDEKYIGSYDTFLPVEQKDLAYHQGTAWPWLIGAFIDALVKIRRYQNKSLDEIKSEIRYYIAPLVDFCVRSPYKSLPELFSGDYPHEPGGTTSQAWSVAEILRVIKEYNIL
ncbi:MAG: amylo-alpha-1,6-glucosidase [Candidatus Aenigmatarchaeota archaeon]